jgi:hypothetical protein
MASVTPYLPKIYTTREEEIERLSKGVKPFFSVASVDGSEGQKEWPERGGLWMSWADREWNIFCPALKDVADRKVAGMLDTRNIWRFCMREIFTESATSWISSDIVTLCLSYILESAPVYCFDRTPSNLSGSVQILTSDAQEKVFTFSQQHLVSPNGAGQGEPTLSPAFLQTLQVLAVIGAPGCYLQWGHQPLGFSKGILQVASIDQVGDFVPAVLETGHGAYGPRMVEQTAKARGCWVAHYPIYDKSNLKPTDWEEPSRPVPSSEVFPLFGIGEDGKLIRKDVREYRLLTPSQWSALEAPSSRGPFGNFDPTLFTAAVFHKVPPKADSSTWWDWGKRIANIYQSYL